MGKTRKVWTYARIAGAQQWAIEEQSQMLKAVCAERSYSVIGSSQEICHSSDLYRPALQEGMKAIQIGRADTVMVARLSRISRDRGQLFLFLRFLQDHHAILITADTELRYELHCKGLENRLRQRAAKKKCGLPWE